MKKRILCRRRRVTRKRIGGKGLYRNPYTGRGRYLKPYSGRGLYLNPYRGKGFRRKRQKYI